MYTINIRGKQNPKDTKMVKLEIIFFKTGYARVPKVINITGLLKDWDVKSQSFRVGSAEATTGRSSIVRPMPNGMSISSVNCRRLQRKNMKKPFPLISLRILQKSFFLTLRFGLKKEVSETL